MTWVVTVFSLIVYIFLIILISVFSYWVYTTVTEVNDSLSNSYIQDKFQGFCWVIGFVLFIFLIYFVHTFKLYIPIFM